MNKELIEQAAREYAEENSWYPGETSYESDIRAMEESFADAFKAGAEWQSKQSFWKTVADEEPPEYKNVLLSAGSCPSLFVGHFNGEDFVVGSTGEVVEYFRVLHWMSIPSV